MRTNRWVNPWTMVLLAGIKLCGLTASAAQADQPAAKPDTPSAEQLPAGQLRLAICQFPVSADVKQNAKWIRKQMQDAAKEHAHVVHFCETALTGYAATQGDLKSSDDIDWKLVREETQSILDLARELKIWVVLGTTHQLKSHKPYNSLYVINPEGKIIDRYDKRFCTGSDLKSYSPGDHFVTFEINGIKCGLLICYDVRFPELYRAYSKEGVQLMFHSFYNAHLDEETTILPIIMPITARAQAASNGMFVSMTNSCAPHSWPGRLIAPNGLVEALLPENEPAMRVVLVNTSKSYYDPSKGHREKAMEGILNSGETVDDEWSKDRTRY